MTIKNRYKQLIIPHNHRGYHFFILSQAKIFIKEGNVVYSSKKDEELIKNIPYLNTSILILGKGTSITSEAINYLSNNKTIIMSVTNTFNLHSVVFPEDSLNTNQYVKPLAQYVFNEDKKLRLAKAMLLLRYDINQKLANKNDVLREIYNSTKSLYENKELNNIQSINELLGIEGDYVKKFRKTFKEVLGISDELMQDFKIRIKLINSLMYGMASIILTAYGLPYGFNIFHGRTNKGALKYDIADLFKGISVMVACLSLIKDFQDFYTIEKNEEKLLKIFSNILIEKFNIIDIGFKETHQLLTKIQKGEI